MKELVEIIREIIREIKQIKRSHQLVGLWAVCSLALLLCCCEKTPLSLLVPIGLNAIASLACALRIQYRQNS